jgi:cell pole-organizing protein PopZ
VNEGAADPGLKVASETMEDDKKTQDDSGDKGDDIELVEGESEALEEQNAPEQSPAVTAGDAGQGLLAENVAVAAMTSMTEVVRAAKTTAKPTALGDGRTLEDLAREMIAPELKVWLDQNLAPLVERVVREEIKKMVRRVEDR